MVLSRKISLQDYQQTVFIKAKMVSTHTNEHLVHDFTYFARLIFIKIHRKNIKSAHMRGLYSWLTNSSFRYKTADVTQISVRSVSMSLRDDDFVQLISMREIQHSRTTSLVFLLIYFSTENFSIYAFRHYEFDVWIGTMPAKSHVQNIQSPKSFQFGNCRLKNPFLWLNIMRRKRWNDGILWPSFSRMWMAFRIL